MSKFYIGCRVDEIEAIWPTKGDTEYKTNVRFKSGNSMTVSPEWREVVRAVEKLLKDRTPTTPDGEVLRILGDWVASGRSYLRAYEKQAIRRLVGVD